jgi:hypothetical protein
MIIPFSIPLPESHNLTYELDYQYDTSSPIWATKDVTVLEALDILKTGLLNNKPVAKIKLFAIFDTKVSIEFVYDIRAAKQGSIPWSLQQTILAPTS